MLNSLIDTFVNLDEPSKNKLLNVLSNVINPIKIYLIVVILLLLIMCLTNYYIFRNLSKVSRLLVLGGVNTIGT